MKLSIGIAAIAATFLMALPAAAQTSFVRIEGKTTKFTSSPTAKSPDSIEVVNVDYSLDVPRDAATGMASGRRRHSPMTFTFRLSSLTPSFFSALIANELLKLEYVTESPAQRGAAAVPASTHRITLHNARISSYKLLDQNGDADRGDPLVKVSFAFQQIDYQSTSNGVAGQLVTDSITQ